MSVASGVTARVRGFSAIRWRRLPSVEVGTSARRHRWSEVVAGVITYAVALYVSYIATWASPGLTDT
jgi:hypothetical protein